MKEKILNYFSSDYRTFYEYFLPNIKSNGQNQYQALCPFHDDKKPSFSFNSKTGLFKCFGCNRSGDIFNFYAEKYGLNSQQDFPEILEGIGAKFGIEKKNNKMNIDKTYDYLNESGELLFQVVRMDPKDFLQRRPDGNGGWIWNLEGVQRVLYHLPAILEADEVLICEGEKDVDNLIALGLTATTNPGGAGKWRSEYNEFLKGKNIVLFPDNHEQGRNHMIQVAVSLNGQAKSIKLIDLPGLADKEDVSDFIAKFNDEEEAAERLCLIIEGAGPYVPPKEPLKEVVQTEVEHLEEKKILQALNTNQDGDAELFIKLNHGRFVYDHGTDKYYYFGKHYWIEDISNKAMASVSKVIQEYSWLVEEETKRRLKAERTGKTEQAKKHKDIIEIIYKRINSLQSVKRKTDILKLAGIDWTDQGRQSLAVTGKEWDSKEMVLPCTNGILNLNINSDPILQNGKPEDYIKTVSPVKWKGIDAPAERWELFLSEIFDGDQDLTNYIQQLFGYSIVGKVTEHILLILYGEGRNGKGTLLEVLNHVLGNLMGSIGIETLLAQKYSRQAGAPSPDLMALKGKRIVWTSEATEGRRFDTGNIKLLTGGDTITARPLFGRRMIDFSPTHTLFFLTNKKPYLPPDDYAIWQRVHLIPFNKKFIDNPQQKDESQRDSHLKEKLKAEAPGILAWLVKGCHLWQEKGILTMPESVKRATAEYQKEVDSVGHFLDACCEIDITDQELRGRAGVLYDVYKEWCKKNGYRYLNNAEFGKNMKKKFKSDKDEHGIYYEGVKLLPSILESATGEKGEK